ncbi:MAG: hypothetical protein ACHQQQ_10250 [Bacteroidota bacterium]
MLRYNKVLIFTLTIIASMFLWLNSARAQRTGSGVGIIVGEPTGLSGKFWVNQISAVDVGLAWSFIDEGSFHVHADYLWHSYNDFRTEDYIAIYYGIGGRIKTSTSGGGRLGVRGTIGLDFFLKDAPFDAFIEAAPIMDLTPKTDLSFNGGVGFRFFFNK